MNPERGRYGVSDPVRAALQIRAVPGHDKSDWSEKRRRPSGTDHASWTCCLAHKGPEQAGSSLLVKRCPHSGESGSFHSGGHDHRLVSFAWRKRPAYVALTFISENILSKGTVHHCNENGWDGDGMRRTDSVPAGDRRRTLERAKPRRSISCARTFYPITNQDKFNTSSSQQELSRSQSPTLCPRSPRVSREQNSICYMEYALTCSCCPLTFFKYDRLKLCISQEGLPSRAIHDASRGAS